jgi:hypothetical protein
VKPVFRLHGQGGLRNILLKVDAYTIERYGLERGLRMKLQQIWQQCFMHGMKDVFGDAGNESRCYKRHV